MLLLTFFLWWSFRNWVWFFGTFGIMFSCHFVVVSSSPACEEESGGHTRFPTSREWMNAAGISYGPHLDRAAFFTFVLPVSDVSATRYICKCDFGKVLGNHPFSKTLQSAYLASLTVVWAPCALGCFGWVFQHMCVAAFANQCRSWGGFFLEETSIFRADMAPTFRCTSSTAQGGGGSFKNRKPIGEIGCCESGMAERIHWWTERCLRSPLFLSLSLTIYLPTYLSSMYLSIYRSTSLSLSSNYLSIYLSICLSIYLSLSLSLSSVYLSSCLPVYLSIYLSICLSVYLSTCLSVLQCHSV